MALVNYVFAKTSVGLGGRKAARVALEKLNQFVIKDEWVEELEIENLKARGFRSSESVDTIFRCYRCGNKSEVTAKNNTCGNCYHPMVLSGLSFTNLPLVEFEVVGGITHEQVIENLQKDTGAKKTASKKKGKMWNFDMEGGEQGQGDANGEDDGEAQVLDLEKEREQAKDLESDTVFAEKVAEACDLQIA